MSRGIGEVEFLQGLLPDWTAPLIALLTQLGDIWFLILLLTVLYWSQVERQDDILLVGGMLVAGIGFYRWLKFTFGFPRPDEPLLDPELVPWMIRPLYELTAFSASYGFPSGHATISTIVYVGLATVLPVGPRRLRYAVAGALVALVGATRIALGLHFLVDILVGTAIGLLVLFVGFRGAGYLSGDRLTILLFVALVLNALYLLASRFHIEAVIVFGGALGLFGGWQLVALAREITVLDRPSLAFRPLAVRGMLAILAIAPLVVVLEIFPVLGAEPYATGGVAGLVATGLVVVPIARHSARVRRVLAALWFWTRALWQTCQTVVRRVLR